MSPTTLLVLTAVIAAGAGLGIGYFLLKRNPSRLPALPTGQAGGRQGLSPEASEAKINEKLAQARATLAELKKTAEETNEVARAKLEKELDQRREKIVSLEKRLTDREERVDVKLQQLEKREETLTREQEKLKTAATNVELLQAEEEGRLKEISGLTNEQAAQRALELAEQRTKEEIVRRVRKLEQEGERAIEDKARNMLATVIQRYASSHVAETTTSHVSVPDESMIGRVIGKEGRNIQHLERLTGCEIVIDETPNSIMVSGFSPLRRQVAKTALERLLKDGRIHPGRIEEVVEEAKHEINKDILEAGEAAVYDLGIVDFPEKLVQLVGRLKYRTSYRQNILNHSWEAAHVARMLAEELGANVDLAKKATLLHDIGKAIDHEVEGNHVEIGEKIMRKFGISEAIIRAAAAHHEDYPFDTIEAIIVQVSDAISAARPGARRDSLENYVKRMEDLEAIATAHQGVKKAYAIYAGREVRVFVEPNKVDDLTAIKMAQDIARDIEQQMTYPGEIKVNVIRETRADSLAR